MKHLSYYCPRKFQELTQVFNAEAFTYIDPVEDELLLPLYDQFGTVLDKYAKYDEDGNLEYDLEQVVSDFEEAASYYAPDSHMSVSLPCLMARALVEAIKNDQKNQYEYHFLTYIQTYAALITTAAIMSDNELYIPTLDKYVSFLDELLFPQVNTIINVVHNLCKNTTDWAIITNSAFMLAQHIDRHINIKGYKLVLPIREYIKCSHCKVGGKMVEIDKVPLPKYINKKIFNIFAKKQ